MKWDMKPIQEKNNVLDVMNLAIPAWMTNFQEKTTTNYFRHYKIYLEDEILENLNEPNHL